MAKFKVLRGCTLNQFLADQMGVSKTKVKNMLDSRTVFVNQQRVWIAAFHLRPGDIVEAIAPQSKQEHTVLFEDPFFVVVNKPAGIVTNGEHSLESRLQKKYPTLQAIHRLDKDTSGVVLFAKSKTIFESMKELFKQKDVFKEYQALVAGSISRSQTITAPIDGESAVSHLTVVKQHVGYTHIRVQIETGRKHQIRIHCAQIGHPVLGEKQYVLHPIGDARLRAIPRQMLHAACIRFMHPETKALVSFTAPLPDDFRKLI